MTLKNQELLQLSGGILPSDGHSLLLAFLHTQRVILILIWTPELCPIRICILFYKSWMLEKEVIRISWK